MHRHTPCEERMRVYELARELGLESKDVLGASSTWVLM